MLGGFVLGIVESLGAGFISTGYKDVIALSFSLSFSSSGPAGLLANLVVEKVAYVFKNQNPNTEKQAVRSWMISQSRKNL